MRTFILSEYRQYRKTVLIERVKTAPEEPTWYKVTTCKRFTSLKNATDAFLDELPDKNKEGHQKQIKDTLNRFFSGNENPPEP